MQKKIKLSIVALTVLVLCILTANLVLGTVPSLNAENVAGEALSVDIGDELERLKDLTPATLEEAEVSIYPVRNRFLMWTRDGAHIMWILRQRTVRGNG